jgi:cell shape-determining protein MreC
VLFVLIITIIRFVAPGAFIAIASPFWSVGTMLSGAVDFSTKGFKNSAIVANERDNLVTENSTLQEQNRTLTARVQDLQNLLGSRTEGSSAILASVLARPPVAPYDVLIVDQGTASRVSLGATAFGPGGTPIGTVASVTKNTARITLYSNPGLETAAWAGEARVPITLRGTGSGGFEATLPKTAGVTVGQGIYVASTGAVPVGTVARVNSDPSSPNVVLQIHPYLNPFSLTWITISSIGS